MTTIKEATSINVHLIEELDDKLPPTKRQAYFDLRFHRYLYAETEEATLFLAGALWTCSTLIIQVGQF